MFYHHVLPCGQPAPTAHLGKQHQQKSYVNKVNSLKASIDLTDCSFNLCKAVFSLFSLGDEQSFSQLQVLERLTSRYIDVPAFQLFDEFFAHFKELFLYRREDQRRPEDEDDDDAELTVKYALVDAGDTRLWLLATGNADLHMAYEILAAFYWSRLCDFATHGRQMQRTSTPKPGELRRLNTAFVDLTTSYEIKYIDEDSDDDAAHDASCTSDKFLEATEQQQQHHELKLLTNKQNLSNLNKFRHYFAKCAKHAAKKNNDNQQLLRCMRHHFDLHSAHDDNMDKHGQPTAQSSSSSVVRTSHITSASSMGHTRSLVHRCLKLLSCCPTCK